MMKLILSISFLFLAPFALAQESYPPVNFEDTGTEINEESSVPPPADFSELSSTTSEVEATEPESIDENLSSEATEPSTEEEISNEAEIVGTNKAMADKIFSKKKVQSSANSGDWVKDALSKQDERKSWIKEALDKRYSIYKSSKYTEKKTKEPEIGKDKDKDKIKEKEAVADKDKTKEAKDSKDKTKDDKDSSKKTADTRNNKSLPDPAPNSTKNIPSTKSGTVCTGSSCNKQ